jgi:SPP1 gp7 family putative phage head morphogenesis protein
VSGDDFDDVPDVGFDGNFENATDTMLRFLREKVVLTAEEFYSLDEAARLRAFTVSGVTDLDLVTDVWEAIESAVKNGETLEDFRARVGEALASEWGGEDASRLDMIFRTNVQNAYSAGRAYQNSRVRGTHPFERYDVVDDDRTSDICEKFIGKIVPSGTGPVPPLHFNCRTDKVAITEEEAQELGGVDEDLGEPGEGFGGNPMAEWIPDVSSRPPELASIYELKVAKGDA